MDGGEGAGGGGREVDGGLLGFEDGEGFAFEDGVTDLFAPIADFDFADGFSDGGDLDLCGHGKGSGLRDDG